MTTSDLNPGQRIVTVEVSLDRIMVALADGRTISVPTVWYPRLAGATLEALRHVRVSGGGFCLHWPELDEDISVAGMLRGTYPGQRPPERRVVPQPAPEEWPAQGATGHSVLHPIAALGSETDDALAASSTGRRFSPAYENATYSAGLIAQRWLDAYIEAHPEVRAFPTAAFQRFMEELDIRLTQHGVAVPPTDDAHDAVRISAEQSAQRAWDIAEKTGKRNWVAKKPVPPKT